MRRDGGFTRIAPGGLRSSSSGRTRTWRPGQELYFGETLLWALLATRPPGATRATR